MAINNQRPGVYSRYDVTSVYASPRSLKYAAVVAKADGGEINTLYRFTSYADACGVFSPDTDGVFMRALTGILFESGVSEILAVPVGTSYEPALAVIEETENIGALICDAAALSDLQAVKASVLKSAEALRERVAFCGNSDPVKAISAATALNCERVVLACPAANAKNYAGRGAVLAACALAAKILVLGDAAANLNGEPMERLAEPDTLPEATIQSLLSSGVCVFESIGGEVECIRAVTTRTKTNDAPDRSLMGLNTILIIDDVLQNLRAALKTRLRGGRIAGASMQTIHSQVVVELAARQSEGLLESFETPRVYASADDPAVCVVELSFSVAHVISQIHVTAHIQV